MAIAKRARVLHSNWYRKTSSSDLHKNKFTWLLKVFSFVSERITLTGDDDKEAGALML